MVLVLLVSGALLLAARDLWVLQARGVGELLALAGVPHRVITSETRLAATRIGELSRDRSVRTASGPVVQVDAPRPRRPTPLQAAAAAAALVGATAALTRPRRLPTFARGAVLVGGLVAVGTVAYQAFWSPLAPLDVRFLQVDWRTSAVVPAVAVALLYAYELYPLEGSFVLKTLLLGAGLAATAALSVLRLAAVAASYAAFGPAAFLAAHHLAGVFWDLAGGMAVLAAGHALLPLTRRRR